MTAVDLSGIHGPVRDQGRRGTCLAFAITAIHEHERHAIGQPVELGEEILYWLCKKIDGDDQSGTYPTSVARALGETGQSPDVLWPYDPDRDESLSTYRPPEVAIAPENLLRGRVQACVADLDTLRALLVDRRAVVVALDLWPEFFHAPAGLTGVPMATELLGEGHAVALVGFDDNAQEFLLRNSWGEGWGSNGYGRLPYAALPVAVVGAWTLEELEVAITHATTA